MMIERLRDDHARMVALSYQLEALVSPEVPGDLVAIGACRLMLARLIMQHLSDEDEHLYRHLERHPHRRSAAIARSFRAELESLQSQYGDHVRRFPAATVARDWADYRISVRSLAAVLRDRIEREERDLLPLLVTSQLQTLKPVRS